MSGSIIPADYISMRDMVDGGGPGASGADFKGGPFSDILNRVGVEPLGYNPSQQQQRPQARPMPQQQPQMATRGYAPPPVSVSPLQPQTPSMPQDPPSRSMPQDVVGARAKLEQMSDDELVRLAKAAGIL